MSNYFTFFLALALCTLSCNSYAMDWEYYFAQTDTQENMDYFEEIFAERAISNINNAEEVKDNKVVFNSGK